MDPSKDDDLRSAQARLNVALGQRDAAQAQLNLLKAGSTPEQIDAAKARVAQAQAALDETTLLAPFDGTITEMIVNAGRNRRPRPAHRQPGRLDAMASGDGRPERSGRGRTSSRAPRSPSKWMRCPTCTLKGQVKSIVPRSIVKRGDVTYTVKVAVTDPDPRLKWGMTAFVDIQR